MNKKNVINEIARLKTLMNINEDESGIYQAMDNIATHYLNNIQKEIDGIDELTEHIKLLGKQYGKEDLFFSMLHNLKLRKNSLLDATKENIISSLEFDFKKYKQEIELNDNLDNIFNSNEVPDEIIKNLLFKAFYYGFPDEFEIINYPSELMRQDKLPKRITNIVNYILDGNDIEIDLINYDRTAILNKEKITSILTDYKKENPESYRDLLNDIDKYYIDDYKSFDIILNAII